MVGSFGEVFVLDWGVARAGADTADGSIVGTSGFMAPEQAIGGGAGADVRSDVYSLGAILSLLLETEGAEQARTSLPLRSVCRRALAEDPKDRYSGVAELSADVARYLDDEVPLAHRERWIERVSRFVSRNRTAVALVAAYLLLRAVLAIVAGR